MGFNNSRHSGWFVGFLWLFFQDYTYAQKAKIPLLKHQFEQATSDSVRSRLLTELGHVYTDESNDSCFYFLNQALQLAQKSGNSVSITRAMCQLGKANLYVQKDESKASYYLQKTIQRAKSDNDYLHLSNAYRMLAVIAIHQHIGDAEEWVNQSVTYAKKSKNWRALTDAYDAQFQILVLLGVQDFNRLSTILRYSMTVCESYDPDHWLTVGLDYCDFLAQNGKQAESLALAQKIASQTGKLKKSYGEFVYANDMARLATKLHQYNEAEKILLNAIAKKIQQPKPDTLHLYFHHLALVASYEQQGAWEKAHKAGKKLTDLRLYLQRKRQTNDARLQATQLKGTLDLAKKQVEIDLLAAREQQQQLLIAGASLLAVLLIAFVLVQRKNLLRIERQKAELAHLNSTKDKLFAILSHDLRSPVAQLHNELMLTNWGAINQQDFSELTQRLGQSISRVSTMFDNLLNWALSQMGGIQAKPASVAVSSLLDEEINVLLPVTNTKQITISHQLPPDLRIMADPNHLAIILRNLLQNAIKFSHPGSEVWIDYQAFPNGLQVNIHDQGVGILPDKLATIFQLSTRSHQPGTKSERGTGLGLVLVRELMEANGGQVQVTSELGRRSTFTLNFTT
jgi:signal transduction histidine kinase